MGIIKQRTGNTYELIAVNRFFNDEVKRVTAKLKESRIDYPTYGLKIKM